MKVSDYKIVTAANPKKVANAVMAYLHDGWEFLALLFRRRKALVRRS